MKKFTVLPLLLLLLFCLPTFALADSTPERNLAVVTPAEEEDETDFSTENADDNLIRPVEDEKSDIKSDEESNEESDEKSDTESDIKSDEIVDENIDNNNEDKTDDTKTDLPELPGSLNVQFFDNATQKQVWQSVTPVNLLLNGSYLASDVPGMATSGRTLVPVRVISEALAATVDWKKEDNTVTVTLGSRVIVLTIGENTALVNGVSVPVPDDVSVALVSYDGTARTMVPIRFVSENLSATVNYDGTTRSVDIIPPVLTDDGEIKEEETLPPPGLAADGSLLRRVVIDAGHGGEDPGTNGGGWEEKVITLSVAEKVQALLEEAEFEVIMSRTDDTFIALTDRAALTRTADAPIFVSIHCNAAENIPTANGIETYAAPNDDDDAELAGYLQSQLIAATGAKDRGVKTSRLVVLTHNEAPAALVEIGFMTNTDECAKITDDTYQDTLAAAIAAGINDYFAAK